MKNKPSINPSLSKAQKLQDDKPFAAFLYLLCSTLSLGTCRGKFNSKRARIDGIIEAFRRAARPSDNQWHPIERQSSRNRPWMPLDDTNQPYQMNRHSPMTMKDWFGYMEVLWYFHGTCTRPMQSDRWFRSNFFEKLGRRQDNALARKLMQVKTRARKTSRSFPNRSRHVMNSRPGASQTTRQPGHLVGLVKHL